MNLPEEIAEYIDAYLYGELNLQQKVFLQQWLESDPEHSIYFEEYCRVWYIGKSAGEWARLNTEESWEKLIQRYRKYKWRLHLYKMVGVAALVGIFIGVACFFMYRVVRHSDKLADGVISESSSRIHLRLASGKTIDLGQAVKQKLWEDGTEISVDSSFLSYNAASAPAQVYLYNELTVPRGGEFEILLSDNSRIFMNSDSRLRFPVRFAESRREVWLEGEAWFDVQKNPDYPFIVHTPDADVTVLGTEFTISAYPEEELTQVILVNGKVNIHTNGKNTELKPDQQFTFNRTSGIQEIKTVDATLCVAWKEGVLNFKSMTLQELAKRLERWFDVEFVFENSRLGQLQFSGAFKRYNDIPYILDIIGKTTEVKFEIQGKVIMVRAL